MRKLFIKRFIIIASIFVNVVFVILLIGLTFTYYYWLPSKYKSMITEMKGLIPDVQFCNMMYPIASTSSVTLFQAKATSDEKARAAIFEINRCQYMFYYNGKDFICIYDRFAKLGWRNDINKTGTFQMFTNTRGECGKSCDDCVAVQQYMSTEHPEM